MKSTVIESGGDVYRSRKVADRAIRVLHQPGASDLIYEVAKEHAPDLIVEIGTGNGGITLALHEVCPEAEIHSFDIYNDPSGSSYVTPRQEQFTAGFAYRYPPELVGEPTPRAWYGANVHFHKADADGEDCLGLKELLEQNVRKFLYCDGGQVAIEAGLWAPLLRPGDLLGLHRWGLEFHETGEAALTAMGFCRHRWDLFEPKGYMTRFWMRAA